MNICSLQLDPPANSTGLNSLSTSQSVASILKSGTINSGVVRLTVSLQRYTRIGLWSLAFVRCNDLYGRETTVYAGQLDSIGLAPNAFINQTGFEDTNPPTLIAFAFSPLIVNTSFSSQEIRISLTASDDLSGFR